MLAREGFHTTQPVLSRDLRALGASKREGAYRLANENRVTPLGALSSLLRGARTAGENLVCIRCEPGAASALARALESDPTPGIIGSVAGDDTVLVAVENAAAAGSLVQHLLSFLEDPQEPGSNGSSS